MVVLALLLGLSISEDHPSISRDDTYHEHLVNSSATFWVQPWPGHAAVICVHKSDYHFTAQYLEFGEGEKWTDLSKKQSARTGSYIETIFVFSIANPGLFRITCTDAGPCPMVLNHVHTDPVFRASVVMGAFALFVCLFLFVLSWTVFCGACRATRKR
jgi:hypothetical protein